VLLTNKNHLHGKTIFCVGENFGSLSTCRRYGQEMGLHPIAAAARSNQFPAQKETSGIWLLGRAAQHTSCPLQVDVINDLC
jgi:hypothetical protein